MIIALGRLTYEDVFEDLTTGKFYIVKDVAGAMVEVKEAQRKRFWAWPSATKVRINKATWESLNQLTSPQ